MADATVHQCRCPPCPGGAAHLNLLTGRLGGQQRRWLAALESQKVGHGGDPPLAQITGPHVDTIRRGRQELGAGREGRPTDRGRRPGGGRPPGKQKPRPSRRA
jgi:hypothetical protein